MSSVTSISLGRIPQTFVDQPHPHVEKSPDQAVGQRAVNGESQRARAVR